MTLLGIAIFVLSGYLVSRAAVRHGLHRPLVGSLLRAAARRPTSSVLALCGAAASMSAVLPNALTILALLPLLQEATRDMDDEARTLLSLAVVYGANIGGTASLTGSPANLYLVATLHTLEVGGTSRLSFAAWLAFGLPLALLLVPAAWLSLRTAFPAHVWRNLRSSLPPQRGAPGNRRFALVLVGIAALHVAVALAAGAMPSPLSHWTLWRIRPTFGDLLVLLLFAAVAGLLFLVPGRILKGEDTERGPCLTVSDLWRGTPWRGVALALAVAGALLVVAQAGAAGLLARAAAVLESLTGGGMAAVAGLVVVSIFGTEFLNNTTVATVLVPVAAAYARRAGVHPLALPIGVSLASTCAFMSPMATPVNALAIGSLSGIKLRRMLAAGLVLNLIGAALVTLWVEFVIPAVL